MAKTSWHYLFIAQLNTKSTVSSKWPLQTHGLFSQYASLVADLDSDGFRGRTNSNNRLISQNISHFHSKLQKEIKQEKNRKKNI